MQDLLFSNTVAVPQMNGPASKTIQKETVLVIDWSNIFFRTLYMHQIIGGPKAGENYTRKEDLVSFGHKLCIDVLAIINIFKPDYVVVATDSKGAWRDELLMNADGSTDYKKGREKDPNINWEALYNVSDQIREILRTKVGAIVAYCEHAEADDIVALIKETVWKSQEMPYNMIVVSADADLRQLLEFDKDSHQFCLVYNTTTRPKSKTRRLYVPNGFMEWLNDNSTDIFFSNYDPCQQMMKNIIEQNKQIEPFAENPNEIVLSKIFCGDDSDAVPSIYNYYRNGRASRVTPAKYKKICEMLDITDTASLVQQRVNIPAAIEKVCKIRPDDVDFDERILRQRRLVELDSSLFPKSIADYRETIHYMLEMSPGDVHMKCPFRAQDILKGTDFEGGDKREALEAEVFRDFERMTGKKTENLTVGGKIIQRKVSVDLPGKVAVNPSSIDINDILSNSLF
jgi:5'-3' exonuclease